MEVFFLESQKKKLILFFSILLLSIISVSSVLIWMSPIPPETSEVNTDWLMVDVGDYVDVGGSGTPEGTLKISTGGTDLIAMESLGVYSQTEDIVVFQAKATFGTELNIYTTGDIFSAYPNIDINRISKTRWLKAYQKQYNNREYGDANEYYVHYRDIDLDKYRDDSRSPRFYSHHYNGYLPITLDINPIWGVEDNININGIDIETTDIAYQIATIKVSETRSGFCGDYNDEYTKQITTHGLVEVVELSPELKADKTNYKPSRLVGEVANLDLYWDVKETRDGLTEQNYKLVAEPEGREFYNTNAGNFTFSLPFELRPEIIKTVQELNIRYASIKVQTKDGSYHKARVINVLDGPYTKNPIRLLSVHLTNMFIHHEFEFNVYFLATCYLKGKLSESQLNDPYFLQGDWLWDTSIQSEDPAIPQPKGDPSLGDLISDWFGGIFPDMGGVVDIIVIIVIVIISIVALVVIVKIWIARKATKTGKGIVKRIFKK